MAVSSLLALIDDIATVLDDVAILGRVAAKKTAGVLGDDLALNAQQVTGFAADRELPVVLAVAKGSLVNKAILVPLAVLISALAPWAIMPLLMVGGLYLCFEGVEKIAHKLLHSAAEDEAHHAELQRHVADTSVDLATLEKEKVQGAIRTDFVLSAEIITITLGVVADQPLMQQLLVLAVVAVVMTIGVYGLVGAIVKIDDLGLHWSQREGSSALSGLLRATGRGLLVFAPWLMKALAVVGTVAMFLVGGGILMHGWPQAHHALLALWPAAASGGLAMLADGVMGLLGGAAALLVVSAVQALRRRLA